METHKVELGGVTLHGYADTPDPFAGLVVTAVNGWRGLSGARGDNDPVPGAHGSYGAARLLRESRSIEVRGAAVAASEFDAVSMLGDLEAAISDEPVEMWVHDAQGAYSRVVEVEALQIIGAYNRDRIIFAIDAIAPDPRRYRAWQQLGPVGLPQREGGLELPSEFPWSFGIRSGGTLELKNVGSVEMLPVLMVSGGFDAVTVDVGGRLLMFGEVREGETLVLDSVQRRAFLGGRDVTAQLLRREWPRVPAGDTQTVRFACTNPSSPTLAARYRIGDK